MVRSYRRTAFCAKRLDIRLSRQLGTHQAVGMDNDADSPAIIDPVESSAPGDADDSLGFVRGLAYGLACAVPFWGLIIASAWLVF
jgi:hypothetical protein